MIRVYVSGLGWGYRFGYVQSGIRRRFYNPCKRRKCSRVVVAYVVCTGGALRLDDLPEYEGAWACT